MLRRRAVFLFNSGSFYFFYALLRKIIADEIRECEIFEFIYIPFFPRFLFSVSRAGEISRDFEGKKGHLRIIYSLNPEVYRF